MPDAFRDLLTGLLGLLTGAGGAAFWQSVRKPSSRAEAEIAQGTLTRDLNETALELLKELREERKKDRADIDRHRADIDRLSAEHGQCLRENDELRAYVGRLEARVRQLEASLLARDLTEMSDALPGTAAIIEKDRATMIRSPRSRTRRRTAK